METWHSILSRWIKPWTKVSPLARIPPFILTLSLRRRRRRRRRSIGHRGSLRFRRGIQLICWDAAHNDLLYVGILDGWIIRLHKDVLHEANSDGGLSYPTSSNHNKLQREKGNIYIKILSTILIKAP